jgi:hypothetical protein
VLVLITDHNGGVAVRGGEHFLILLGEEAYARRAEERVQRVVDFGPRRVGEFGAQSGEADPAARPRREGGIRVADAVFDGRQCRLVAAGAEQVGEAEVGTVQVAIEGGQDGVEGFRRSGRSRRRAGGEDVVAEPPAAVGELVHESSSAAVGFDQPELVEFVASGLVEFRPES